MPGHSTTQIHKIHKTIYNLLFRASLNRNVQHIFLVDRTVVALHPSLFLLLNLYVLLSIEQRKTRKLSITTGYRHRVS